MNISALCTGSLSAGIVAFSIWGSLVLYWKQLEAIPPTEILLYRIVCSFILLLPTIWLTHRLPEIRHVLQTSHLRRRLLCCACTITFNWGLYIWAVTNGHITESSLGYYINPLMNVLAGALFCQERPSRLQWLAVGIAAIGVSWSLLAYGEFPWVAVALASSFTLYGLLRKKVAVGALSGLFVETLILFPPALIWLIWVHMQGQGHFFTANNTELYFIMASGLVTTLPLVLFTYAARHLPLSTLGLIQYISPSLALVIGIHVYHEPISPATMITFACIWTALILYSWSSWLLHKQAVHLSRIAPKK